MKIGFRIQYDSLFFKRQRSYSIRFPDFKKSGFVLSTIHEIRRKRTSYSIRFVFFLKACVRIQYDFRKRRKLISYYAKAVLAFSSAACFALSFRRSSRASGAKSLSSNGVTVGFCGNGSRFSKSLEERGRSKKFP